MSIDSKAFFVLSLRAARMSQGELAAALGVSRRTAQRYSDHGVPSHLLPRLIAVVHPHDAALAGQIAASMGHTLETLGIVKPPAPPPPPPAPPPPPDRVVDAVVCAAAEAIHVMPGDVRPALLAAFAAAREIGVSLELVERVLRGSVQGAAKPAGASRSATK
jgi:hypothetical protein